MKIALDTNIICKACDLNDPNVDCMGVLTRILHDANHGLLHDTDRKLLNEYRNKAGGYGFFQKWYQEMVRHKWWDGTTKLVPLEWIEDN